MSVEIKDWPWTYSQSSEPEHDAKMLECPPQTIHHRCMRLGLGRSTMGVLLFSTVSRSKSFLTLRPTRDSVMPFPPVDGYVYLPHLLTRKLPWSAETQQSLLSSKPSHTGVYLPWTLICHLWLHCVAAREWSFWETILWKPKGTEEGWTG